MRLSYAGGRDPDDPEGSAGTALPVNELQVGGLATAASSEAVDRFRRIHAANYSRLVGYATRRTSNDEDAADVVAETLLVAWKNLAKVPPGDEATPWLFGVARGVLANQQRSERRRFRLARQIGFELHSSKAFVDEPSTDLVEVAEAFATLSATDREVLSLAVWEGLSPAELAVALGCSSGAAKVRLSRARTRLQRSIARGQRTRRSMSTDLHDDDHLDALVAGLASVDDTEIRDRADDDVAQALLEHIVAGDLVTARRGGLPGERVRPRKVMTVAAGLVAVAVLVAAVLALVPSSPAYRSASVPVVLDTPSGSSLTASIPGRDIHHGKVAWSKVPTYVAVYTGRKLIGYVKKTAIQHPPVVAEPQMEPPHLPDSPNSQVPQIFRLCPRLGIDVYNGSHTLIGHIYPGSGYVALGGTPFCRSL